MGDGVSAVKPLRDNFREGAPISQVPASWFNEVAAFINSLIPGFGIQWAKSATMNVIEVSRDILNGIVRSVDGVPPDSGGNVQIGAVKEVDGHSPDSSGSVSFGLTASKWVKTDSSGHLATTNDSVVSVPSGTTPQSVSSMNIITDVVWNGTTLRKKYRTATFTNGVLTSIGSETTSTIDTPTVVTWR